jgi:hypothetical protein
MGRVPACCLLLCTAALVVPGAANASDRLHVQVCGAGGCHEETLAELPTSAALAIGAALRAPATPCVLAGAFSAAPAPLVIPGVGEITVCAEPTVTETGSTRGVVVVTYPGRRFSVDVDSYSGSSCSASGERLGLIGTDGTSVHLGHVAAPCD